MKKFIILYTESSKSYLVNEKMEITQYNSNCALDQHKFSGQWIFKGLVTRLHGNNLINAKQLFEKTVIDDINFTFKNGNPRFTVLDIDHGTTRSWGDGIRSISII